MPYRYEVTKTFTDGLLKGLSITERTNVPYRLNATYKGILGYDSYRIASVRILDNNLDYFEEI